MKLIANNFTGRYTDGTRYKLEFKKGAKYLHIIKSHFINGKWETDSKVRERRTTDFHEDLSDLILAAESEWGIKLHRSPAQMSA